MDDEKRKSILAIIRNAQKENIENQSFYERHTQKRDRPENDILLASLPAKRSRIVIKPHDDDGYDDGDSDDNDDDDEEESSEYSTMMELINNFGKDFSIETERRMLVNWFGTDSIEAIDRMEREVVANAIDKVQRSLKLVKNNAQSEGKPNATSDLFATDEDFKQSWNYQSNEPEIVDNKEITEDFFTTDDKETIENEPDVFGIGNICADWPFDPAEVIEPKTYDFLPFEQPQDETVWSFSKEINKYSMEQTNTKNLLFGNSPINFLTPCNFNVDSTLKQAKIWETPRKIFRNLNNYNGRDDFNSKNWLIGSPKFDFGHNVVENRNILNDRYSPKINRNAFKLNFDTFDGDSRFRDVHSHNRTPICSPTLDYFNHAEDEVLNVVANLNVNYQFGQFKNFS